ncbi:MAG: hypothetical protein ACO1SX_13755 [Actinomycetota bacterium]
MRRKLRNALIYVASSILVMVLGSWWIFHYCRTELPKALMGAFKPPPAQTAPATPKRP